MYISEKVKLVLQNYSFESPAVRTNLARILMTGALAGTGKLLILPVDQGFEHGPDQSFMKNDPSYDPEYHINLAIDAKLNAYAAPKGMLEAIIDQYFGRIPLILKLNSSNSLYSSINEPKQSFTASIKDAVYMGCNAVGITIYPGSDHSLDSIQEVSEYISEAKSYGIPVIIWSYPRGNGIKKGYETAIDVTSYAIHIAALLGANIIKVKPPSNKTLSSEEIHRSSLNERVAHVMKAAFLKKRLVMFSGGNRKNTEELLEEIKMLKLGGANGSIIGRNAFQRPRLEALELLNKIINIYKSE